MNEFKKLGLSKITLEALEKKGFVTPSPIQAQTIPVLLEGEFDVIGQAQTGTGKTACFALPILENLNKGKKVQAIILAPTRELAIQVAKEIDSLKGERRVKVLPIYGGSSIQDQMSELKRGVDIVVGTPGRVMDLMNRNRLDISEVSYAVLDEADEMLNMGFVEDIQDILRSTPEDKKMLLFSATMPNMILKIAKKFMREYKLIKDESASLATKLIDQKYFNIMGRDRYAALKRIIAITPDFHGLIFCKTKAEVDTVARKLVDNSYSAAALHGDISQGQRESILNQFKAKKIHVLIATDVAARGIDVNDLNVVINYSLPQSPETYVHRIGRTGRAGNKGTAITFLMPSEKRKLKFVEQIIGEKIPLGTLPSVDDIIEIKKSQIATTLSRLLASEKKTEFDEVTKQLLSEHAPEKVISAVLRYAFANELSPSSYSEIGPVSEDDSSDGRGRSRGRGRSSRDRSRGDEGGRGRSEGRFRDSSRSSRHHSSDSGSSRRGRTNSRGGSRKSDNSEHASFDSFAKDKASKVGKNGRNSANRDRRMGSAGKKKSDSSRSSRSSSSSKPRSRSRSR